MIVGNDYIYTYKLSIHLQKLKVTTTIFSLDGRSGLALSIFTHAIRFLKMHLLNAIEQETGKYDIYSCNK